MMEPAADGLACGWHGDLLLLTVFGAVDLSEIVSITGVTGVLDDCGLVFGRVLVCLGG
jgi:hypothetical protein